MTRVPLKPQVRDLTTLNYLGSGHWSHAWMARDKFEGICVIKVPDPSSLALSQLDTWGESLADLIQRMTLFGKGREGHSNRSFAFPDEDVRGNPVVIEEYIPVLFQENRKALLDSYGRIPFEEVFLFTRGIASGLANLEVDGLCHADVTPINTGFVSETKIFDYSHATLLTEDNPNRRDVGLPLTRAPEVIHIGPGNESDAFSLGSTICLYAYGEHVFGAGFMNLNRDGMKKYLLGVNPKRDQPRVNDRIHRLTKKARHSRLFEDTLIDMLQLDHEKRILPSEIRDRLDNEPTMQYGMINESRSFLRTLVMKYGGIDWAGRHL